MKHKKAYKAIKALKKKLAIEKELFRILMDKYGQLLKGEEMKNNILMRQGLTYGYSMCGTDPLETAFEYIEKSGGWPYGYKFLGFVHGADRVAGFTNSPQSTGWWTTVASEDDYTLWKLSPAALQCIVDATVRAIRLPNVAVTDISIINSDYRPALLRKDLTNKELQ